MQRYCSVILKNTFPEQNKRIKPTGKYHIYLESADRFPHSAIVVQHGSSSGWAVESENDQRHVEAE